jgi:hypothetical protein
MLLLALAGAISTAGMTTESTSAAAAAPTEYAVKVNFLYKFGDYVSWPAGAFASETAPVTVCVAGDDPFGPMLNQVLAGEHIGTRPIAAAQMSEVPADTDCRILYLRASKTLDVAATLKALAGKPVLTITDGMNGDAAGVINFVMKDNRVRFEINDRAAAANGLGISSKLLSLALTVRTRE